MMLFSKSFTDLSISIQLLEYSEILNLEHLRHLVIPFLLRYVLTTRAFPFQHGYKCTSVNVSVSPLVM